MPKITIDAEEIEVEEGLNIIQAAARTGIEVPHFCYHPALSIVAQCRQCLVEIEGIPKLIPACSTFVREGLVVITNSQKAINARKATIEFTLINHPLDCPICDKGGECPLQLTAFKHGPGYSRFDGPQEKKVRRKYYLSDNILYDPNRCIMCTRCVRFTDEITHTGELGFMDRGFRKKIVVFPGKNLNNELSGNVIDLCPVGALLDKDTLHEERVWYWKFTDTVCPLCSNGCNITVGIDPRKGRIIRIRPRVNFDVNEYWICDKGRYGFKAVQEENRLKEPIIKKDEEFEIADWGKALDIVSFRIKEALRENTESVAFLCSPMLTNEELYILKKLANLINVKNLYSYAGKPEGEKKFGLISSDPYPNSEGVRDMGFLADLPDIDNLINSIYEREVKALYIIGEDLFRLIPQQDKEKLSDSLSDIPFIVVEDFKSTETLKYADVILPSSTPYEKEGTYTNDTGRVQRIKKTITPPGSAKSDLEILTSLGNRIKKDLLRSTCPSEVMFEISEIISKYKGMNYDKIGMLGVSLLG